jgi:hypothetical protein
VLPAAGEVRSAGEGSLWLLDPGAGVVLAVGPDGSVSHVVGAVRGGGLPLGEQAMEPRQLVLDAPWGLAASAADAWLLLADHTSDGQTALYAVNRGAEDARLAGRDVPAGLAVRLGGEGALPPAEGVALAEASLEGLVGVALVEGGPVLAIEGAGPLWRVGAGGQLARVDYGRPGAPVALAAWGDVLVTADPFGWIEGINLGTAAAEVGNQVLEPGQRLALARAPSAGVADLAVGEGGQVAVLETNGDVSVVAEGFVERVGRTTGQSSSLALAGGGLVALDGGLWAVALAPGAELFGLALPESPGAGLGEGGERPAVRLV